MDIHILYFQYLFPKKGYPFFRITFFYFAYLLKIFIIFGNHYSEKAKRKTKRPFHCYENIQR